MPLDNFPKPISPRKIFSKTITLRTFATRSITRESSPGQLPLLEFPPRAIAPRVFVPRQLFLNNSPLVNYPQEIPSIKSPMDNYWEMFQVDSFWVWTLLTEVSIATRDPSRAVIVNSLLKTYIFSLVLCYWVTKLK